MYIYLHIFTIVLSKIILSTIDKNKGRRIYLHIHSQHMKTKEYKLMLCIDKI